MVSGQESRSAIVRDMVRELLAQPRAAKSAEVGACVGVHVHQVHGGRAICDGEVRFLVVLDGHPEAHGGAPAGATAVGADVPHGSLAAPGVEVGR